MGLLVYGRVLCCIPRKVNYKDGSGSFTMHRCYIHDDSDNNSEPVEVNTGDYALQVGEIYKVPVYGTTYNGAVQFNSMKDNPPQMLKK